MYLQATEGESKLPKAKRRSLLPAIQKSSTISKPIPSILSQTEAANAGIKKLGIGERVSISGVKFGVLKYYGEIPLASGVWCGIDLDDPDGKHDGEVDGRRYFTCRPQHGIFAPVDKVDSVEATQVGTAKDTNLISEECSVNQQDTGKKPQLDESSLSKKRCLPQLFSKSFGSSRLPSTATSSKNEQSQVSTNTTDTKSEMGESNDVHNRSLVARTSSVSASAITPIPPASAESPNPVFEQTSDCISESSRPITVRKIPKPSNLPSGSRLPKFGKSDSSAVPKATKAIKADVSCTVKQSALSQAGGDKTNLPVCGVSDDQSYGEDSFSDGVKLQLKADSRHYLNLTFDAENGLALHNLPDVVSSASPSPEARKQNEHNYTFAVCDNENSPQVECPVLDKTFDVQNVDMKKPLFQVGQLPTAYPGELITSTPLAQEISETCESARHRHGSGSRLPKLPNPGIRELFSKLPGAAMQNQGESRVESGLYEGHDRVLILKDDFVHANRDVSAAVAAEDDLDTTFVVKKGISEIPMPLNEMELLDLLQKEDPIEEFLGVMTESFVQNLEQGLDMTDSGIVDRSMTESTGLDSTCVISTAGSKHDMDTLPIVQDSTISSTCDSTKSMTDSGIAKSMTESGLLDLVSKKKVMVDSGISDESVTCGPHTDLQQQTLEVDLRSGHMKQDRPVSLISTTSADTGNIL